MAEFVHLHVHSEYSLLDGLSSCRELAERAAELGMPALALTDHGTMYGAVQFYKACKAAGIKPIIGVEPYLAPRGRRDRDAQRDRKAYHLTLLAQNDTGYHNLMRLATIAQLEGFYYKPRIDKEVLAEHADGLIVLSGCGTSEVSRLIQAGQLDQARRAIAWYRDTFPGRYYLELQEHDIPELAQVNHQLIAFAREFDLPLVATNDVHYIRRQDASIHDVLLCIGTGKTVNEPKRMRMDGDSFYLRSAEEMAALFPDVPEALSNTLAVAEMCELELEFGHYHLPLFPVPEGYDAQTYLRHLCEEGLQQRYPVITSRERERLDYELDIIHQMGFDTYFLIVWDLCRFSQEQNIWWNVRGSGASSIVAYSLGITNLEPLQHGLIFERFLNLGRVTMPDIDLDYPDDQRDQLIRYTIEKYGHEQVAQIITFGTMGAKAAIRDVGRALDYPLSEVDRIARLVPGGPKVKLDHALEQVPELREAYKTQEHIRRLVDTARGVEGNLRHASTHAAGVIVSDVPLVEYTPLNRPTRGGDSEIGVVTQYTMEELDELGLLKIDFLGLSTLTVMRRACELIRQRHNVDLNLNNIPTDDPIIYDLLTRGDVMGVFQVEGQGMRRVLMKMQPSKFEHIIATISLYRPGPMEYIDDYIDCMHGKKPVEYRHPSLEPILRETYGVCVTGDALIVDTSTGHRWRLDECGNVRDLVVQGVDAQWQTTTGRVTQWVANGEKMVYKVTLRNGAHIKLTYDHKVLTEEGWRAIGELSVGNYIATPQHLIHQNEVYDRDKLRVLAYLIADGDIGNIAAVNFVSKDSALLTEYEHRLKAFPNLRTHRITQLRDVIRISVAKKETSTATYHTPNTLLAWLRELGLKHPPGHKPGGCRAGEKFIPDFVFSLAPDLVTWFLASLWDCDGYMGRKLCHYKTISQRLAENVQTLLLKLGIQATIYAANYDNRTGPHRSYQVTVYDTARLTHLLQPYMITKKRYVDCTGQGCTTITRAPFIAEVEAHTDLSKLALMQKYSIDRQHFYAKRRCCPRISANVVADLANTLNLPETRRKLRLNWEEIISIEPVGVEPVYDLTVEGCHNFVANNILVHNCVYQEQIIRILADIAGYTPGDADLVRRAVGKKKKAALLKHRTSFVEGAIEHSGLSRQAAEGIFGDIEYFARYGFNKSHAADYAVLTCQTAYLKAKYPVEYMTALLTVERHNTEKIGLLIAECRRMGIEVLPPDINCSGLDFTIEEQSNGTPAIRFGLGAVKNVGEGPVETIRAARRAEGTFRDLDDFCRRVDLRQVNRRALESLIKVGALRPFGTRSQLLPISERIVGLSANLHRAQDVGQMSMFGAVTGVRLMAEETLLPPLSKTSQVPQKEILAWEKDLVGVYISEHPLAQVLTRLRDVVTAYAGALREEMSGQQVIVAGTVQRARRHTTKKGDEMAFVTLEDLQGTCDVVVFPRVWAKTKTLWQPGRILVVSGKVDAGRRDEPNLLCDWAKIPDEVAIPNEQGHRLMTKVVTTATPSAAPPVRTVRVTLTRSGEQTRDVQTLRRVHSLLVGHPGLDRFVIHLVDGAGKSVELEFPNDTTHYSPELARELAAVVGAEAVQVVEEGIR